MNQGELPFDADERTIQKHFEEFHKAHPEIMLYLVDLCRLLRNKYNKKQYGIRSLWERARWHFSFERDVTEEFKLNDHLHSRYARRLMEEYPEFEGFFKLRALKAE